MSKESQYTRPDVLAADDVYEMGASGGFDLTIHPIPLGEAEISSPILADMSSSYTLEKFHRIRTPIVVGNGSFEGLPLGLRIHDLPIRFPGTEYRVPRALDVIRGTLETCVSFEAAINPDVDDYFAYLTLQYTDVDPGTSQRVSTTHVDGFQGAHRQPKVRPEHGYIATTRDPSFFYAQSYDFDELDINQDDVAQTLANMSREECVVRCNPNDIVLFDAYTPHRGVVTESPGPRCFFRLRYCDPAHHANRRGRTKNLLFEAEYEQVGWKTTTYAENS